MYHSRGGIDIELAREFPIPPNDAATLLTGRLILEVGDSVKVKSATPSAFKFTFSYLETANA
jgi:hypothetical protein